MSNIHARISAAFLADAKVRCDAAASIPTDAAAADQAIAAIEAGLIESGAVEAPAMVPVPAQQQQAYAGRFHVTFETVTPESAENGDAAARGYVHPNGGTDELDKVDDVEAYAFTLAGAVRAMGHVEDCGAWFVETGSDRCDYRTGAVTTYSLHPPRGVTPSSYRRIARALGAAR